MDEADLAQQSIDFHLQHNLACIRRAQASGAGNGDCDECGQLIPEARRKAVPNCRLCITCQREAER